MNREKVKIGIIGTGNIGTDLLMKVMSSKVLECGIFVGRNLNSEGMIKAKQLNVPITDKSIDYIIENPDCCSIVFDATSASTHLKNAPILKKLGKFTIDLTPSKYGTFCIPVINIDNVLDDNKLNLITSKTDDSIFLGFEPNPNNKIVPEDFENMKFPDIDINKKLYISGKLPAWLFSSISLSYENQEKYILQPGNGFIKYASENKKELGIIEPEINGIDTNKILENYKEYFENEIRK